MGGTNTTNNDNPEKALRPFDNSRNGTVLSDGGAILVIESLECAKKRNAPILCEIIGYHACSEVVHLLRPSENGEGIFKAMMYALKDSGL